MSAQMFSSVPSPQMQITRFGFGIGGGGGGGGAHMPAWHTSPWAQHTSPQQTPLQQGTPRPRHVFPAGRQSTSASTRPTAPSPRNPPSNVPTNSRSARRRDVPAAISRATPANRSEAMAPPASTRSAKQRPDD